MNAIRGSFLAVMGAHRVLSWRRLMVFAVACGFAWHGRIGEWAWVAVAVAFIGGEVLRNAGGLSNLVSGAPLRLVSKHRDNIDGEERDNIDGEERE